MTVSRADVEGEGMSDREAVIAANRAFYDAFESLDIEQMEQVWAREPRILCIHPGWRELSGWGPVMDSWEKIFENVFEVKFQLGEVGVMMSGDLAVVVVRENLTQRGYEGVIKAEVLATNVFERAGAKWGLMLHHGSPVVAQLSGEPRLQ